MQDSMRNAYLEILELRPWSNRGGGMLACGVGSGKAESPLEASALCPLVCQLSGVSSRGGAAGMRGVPIAPKAPKPARQQPQLSLPSASDPAKEVSCQASPRLMTGVYRHGALSGC